MNAAKIYSAGKVRRWHTNPVMSETGQTNADHIGGCVRLLLMLHPDPSVNLIRAVAHHDDGERFAFGDVASPAKIANPKLAAQVEQLEDEMLAEHLGRHIYDDLTETELAWLRFIDRLEAYMHVAMTRPAELAFDGWPRALVRLHEASEALGCSDTTYTMMADTAGRRW